MDEIMVSLYLSFAGHMKDIKDGLSFRLRRKVLPKVTKEGYIEYGLQIPHNYQTLANTRANGNTSIKKEFGADVDWILRATGTVSKGTAGQF